MKKMLFVLTVVLSVLLFAGCDKRSEPVNVAENSDPATAGMMEMVEHMDDKTKEAIAAIPVPETNPELVEPEEPTSSESAQSESAQSEPAKPVDPYEVLVTSPEVCKKYGGYYVLRDGKNYSTGGKLPYEQVKGSGIGTLYHKGNMDSAFYYEWGNADVVSMGDVPIFVIGDDDALVRYGSSIAQLVRYDAEPVASLRVTLDGRHGGVWKVFPSADELPEEIFSMDHVQQFQIEDSDGNVVSVSEYDLGEMTFGQSYKMSYFFGTEYREYELIADSWRYIHPQNGTVIELNGVLNKNGYAVFDLSGLMPGLYRLVGGGVSGTSGFIRIE